MTCYKSFDSSLSLRGHLRWCSPVTTKQRQLSSSPLAATAAPAEGPPLNDEVEHEHPDEDFVEANNCDDVYLVSQEDLLQSKSKLIRELSYDAVLLRMLQIYLFGTDANLSDRDGQLLIELMSTLNKEHITHLSYKRLRIVADQLVELPYKPEVSRQTCS